VIRRRDHLRLSVQKIGLRKKRAFFAVISVALGVVVVVVVNALAASVRELAIRTTWTDDIDADVIRVYAAESPYEYIPPGERKDRPEKRAMFLTETVFAEWRTWPGVEAAAHPVALSDVGIGALTNQPRAATEFTGVPDALLRRYADSQQLAACTNAIPILLGERYARLRYNPKREEFEWAENATRQWLGRELPLRLGDHFAGLRRFKHDYEKKKWIAMDEETITQQREAMERNLGSAYDMTLYGLVLPLRARVVGFCPGARVLLPVGTAELCEKWLTQRRELARLRPDTGSDEPEYSTYGRRTPKTDEYNEGLVLVKRGVDPESVAAQLRKAGYTASTRSSSFESFVKEFDSTLKFVKRVAYAIGGVILVIAAGLLWSTTSRIVSDSRSDIGLFRALGATRRDIRRLFLGETVVLGIVGTLVGIAGGWTAAYYISRWIVRVVTAELSDPEDMLRLPATLFRADLKFALLLLVAAALLSWLAGYWPARRAARIDPVKALKRE